MDDGFGDDQSFWEELVTGIDNHLQVWLTVSSLATADWIISLQAETLELSDTVINNLYHIAALPEKTLSRLDLRTRR